MGWRSVTYGGKYGIGRAKMAKLELHGTETDTDTDTDILADFRARIVARMSACPATSPFSLQRAGHARRSSLTCPATSPFSLQRAGHARRSSPTCPPTCPTRELFLSRILTRMSVRDARVYTCTCVLYTISCRVHVYKITR